MKHTNAFVLRKINGVNFLICVRKNKLGFSLFSLNEVGTCIWELLNNEVEVDYIISTLQTKYDKITEDEINIFIKKLDELGLIEK